MRNTSSFIHIFYKKSFKFLTMYTVANLQNVYEKLRIGCFQYTSGSSVNVSFANFSISTIRNVAVIRLLEKKNMYNQLLFVEDKLYKCEF